MERYPSSIWVEHFSRVAKEPCFDSALWHNLYGFAPKESNGFYLF
jgi:hypothetical protein